MFNLIPRFIRISISWTILPLFSSISLASGSVGAGAVLTTVRIPVYVQGVSHMAPMPMSEFNLRVTNLNSQPLPTFLEIRSDDQNARATINNFDKEIYEVMKMLGIDWDDGDRLLEVRPGEFDTLDLATCYTGDSKAVSALLAPVVDLLYVDLSIKTVHLPHCK